MLLLSFYPYRSRLDQRTYLHSRALLFSFLKKGCPGTFRLCPPKHKRTTQERRLRQLSHMICRLMVPPQSFEHFDVISVVDDSTDHGKLLLICLFVLFCFSFFTITLKVLTSISQSKFLEESRARCFVGQWFQSKVLNILTSFLWSIRVQTVENCC